MKTIATIALLAACMIATPVDAHDVEETLVGCWVHPHTMQVRTPQETAMHLAGETVDCAVELATCTVLHPETREVRTPQQEARHYSGHAIECTLGH